MLGRRWSENGGNIVWIMLNPSKADSVMDDPTVRRCMAFSRAWGYGGLNVVNLYAMCATTPDELRLVEDPVGPDNDSHIAEVCTALAPMDRHTVVAAWGAHPLAQARARHVLSIVGHDVDCLGMTRTGQPRHPLYVPAMQSRTSCRLRDIR
ncbi:DUF1643 domain-containing protein [Rhizobium sp. ARZ01]|uniref:DUF1643 domain-containing protein n=1 Tax=Rhizobium sp. ARZ01 TaxID=2769313 RepID=UPI002484C74A|nr:DUF1643 domain-containing protein [Rhizobium sp. ARZ01]